MKFVLSLSFILPGFFATLSTSAADASAPNILFILADDLGYGDLGCYGCEDIETPHLDRLAEEGLTFTDFYANAAVCTPTRAAFLTGRYQHRIGLDNALSYQEMGRGLPIEDETIADALQRAGYRTGLSGKWHLGYDDGRRPLQQGFDHFFGLLGGNHHYFEHMDRIGVHDLWLGDEPVKRQGYSTDLVTDDAIQFLEQGGESPFFLFLSHPAPHFPWQGPDDIDKEVVPKKKSWQIGDRETYVSMVERMDEGIGEVLAKLDELGLAENTLVIFTSDNGGHSYSRNDPMRDFKATIWEGGTRVPCIVRWPGKIAADTETEQVGMTMDWTATFRRLAGLKADPAGEDGIDLLPYLTDAQNAKARTLFWKRKKGPVRKSIIEGRAVREGNWKLIEQASGERYLFDLKKDVSETTNLIEDHPDLAQRLSELLDAWELEVAVKEP